MFKGDCQSNCSIFSHWFFLLLLKIMKLCIWVPGTSPNWMACLFFFFLMQRNTTVWTWITTEQYQDCSLAYSSFSFMEERKYSPVDLLLEPSQTTSYNIRISIFSDILSRTRWHKETPPQTPSMVWLMRSNQIK